MATTTGCLAVEEFEYYQTKTRSIQETREFLNYLPDDTPLDTDLLTSATITLAEDHAPDQALHPSIDLFEDATALKGLAPVVLTFYPDLIEEQLRQNDLTVEIIAETTVLETLPKLASSQVDPLLDHDAVSLFEANSSLPYALWLMETPNGDYAGITAYDSGGVVGVLINDSEQAIRWARAQYDSYRGAAQTVSVSHLWS